MSFIPCAPDFPKKKIQCPGGLSLIEIPDLFSVISNPESSIKNWLWAWAALNHALQKESNSFRVQVAQFIRTRVGMILSAYALLAKENVYINDANFNTYPTYYFERVLPRNNASLFDILENLNSLTDSSINLYQRQAKQLTEEMKTFFLRHPQLYFPTLNQLYLTKDEEQMACRFLIVDK